jgi:uncharacterized OsmC-like protein
MNAEELRARQGPLKARYRADPTAAALTLTAAGTLDVERLACRLERPGGPIEAGLHPAAGGDGTSACSGDMLLEALVACAGVTLVAVASALAIPLRGGTVAAEGDLDFRGTLGIDKQVPVGFLAIRLHFTLDTDATDEQFETLRKLTERFCVVSQSLTPPPVLVLTRHAPGV